MFSLSLEQTAKCNVQGAEKKSASKPFICQEVQGSFSKLLSNEAWKLVFIGKRCYLFHWSREQNAMLKVLKEINIHALYLSGGTPSYSVMRLERNLSSLALGSDILTP